MGASPFFADMLYAYLLVKLYPVGKWHPKKSILSSFFMASRSASPTECKYISVVS
jgi:hypothetical protein